MSSSHALDHLASGKVRELYDAGDDRLLLVASRPHLGLRRRPADADPRQGPRARPRSRCSGSTLTGDIVAQPRDLGASSSDLPEGARDARARRARDARASGSRCCRSSASCAATSSARAGRTTSAPAPCAAIALPAGLARGRPAAAAALHAVDQGRAERARREHHADAGHRARRRRALPRGRARLDRALRARGRSGAASAGSSSPTRSSSSAIDADGALVRGRRGADARLVALLAGRQLRTRLSLAAVLRQAVRARLARDARLGQDARPAPSCPTRCATAPRRATARPTSASPDGRSRAYLEEMGVRA